MMWAISRFVPPVAPLWGNCTGLSAPSECGPCQLAGDVEAVFDAAAVQAELRSSQPEVLREAEAALEARCSTRPEHDAFCRQGAAAEGRCRHWHTVTPACGVMSRSVAPLMSMRAAFGWS